MSKDISKKVHIFKELPHHAEGNILEIVVMIIIEDHIEIEDPLKEKGIQTRVEDHLIEGGIPIGIEDLLEEEDTLEEDPLMVEDPLMEMEDPQTEMEDPLDPQWTRTIRTSRTSWTSKTCDSAATPYNARHLHFGGYF